MKIIKKIASAYKREAEIRKIQFKKKEVRTDEEVAKLEQWNKESRRNTTIPLIPIGIVYFALFRVIKRVHKTS